MLANIAHTERWETTRRKRKSKADVPGTPPSHTLTCIDEVAKQTEAAIVQILTRDGSTAAEAPTWREGGVGAEIAGIEVDRAPAKHQLHQHGGAVFSVKPSPGVDASAVRQSGRQGLLATDNALALHAHLRSLLGKEFWSFKTVGDGGCG